ncbi:hypothetical protein BSLG_005803 [Batrachochytrium salamandrivorans]|nr:hypothetical protein BSLG_005803 [Batrachochytrium salamandrivorans]
MQPVARLLIIGVIFHAIYTWSIFDIYFRSPLVHGMEHVEPLTPAPAKRLLLLVGWKTNPVNFDSVFNQSRHTWSFGSPDILPMFAFGASEHSRVDTYMYSAEHEDFGKDDASSLDTWVFDHFDALLESSKTNSTLFELLHSDKISAWIDTSGHSHRPNSPEYYANIELVDKGIQVVENKLKAFYNDDKRTATVFTADHGMGTEPFKPLAQYQDIVSKIQALIDLEKFEEAERESIRLIQVCIDGLRYYQTYDWLFCGQSSRLDMLDGLYTALFLLRMYVLEDSKRSRGISISSKTRDLVTSIIRTPWSQNRTNVLGHIIVYTVILEILVYTYFRREVLSICLIAVGIVWPIMMPAGFKNGKLVLAWRIASICTSVFTLLPVEVEQDI